MSTTPEFKALLPGIGRERQGQERADPYPPLRPGGQGGRGAAAGGQRGGVRRRDQGRVILSCDWSEHGNTEL